MSRDPLAPSNRAPSTTNEVATSTADVEMPTGLGSKDDLRSALRGELHARSASSDPAPGPSNVSPANTGPSNTNGPSTDLGAVTQLVADLAKRVDSLEQKFHTLVEGQATSPGTGAQPDPGGAEVSGKIARVAYDQLGIVLIPSETAKFGHQELTPESPLGRAMDAILREGGHVALTDVKES